MGDLLFSEKLQSLWASECKLQEISDLQACTQLVNLHLSSNNITKIGGLRGLTNLQVGNGTLLNHLNYKLTQVLWLNNNNIQCILGLEDLDLLRVLWLCGNRIASIGNGAIIALRSLMRDCAVLQASHIIKA